MGAHEWLCEAPRADRWVSDSIPSAAAVLCKRAWAPGLPQPEQWAPCHLVPVQLPGARQAEAFVTAFLKRSMPRMSQQACEEHLQRKAVVLEYSARRKRKEKKKKSKGLSARQRRELRLFDIKPEQQRYAESFLPFYVGCLIFPVWAGLGKPSTFGSPFPIMLWELLPLQPQEGSVPLPIQTMFGLGFYSEHSQALSILLFGFCPSLN